MRNYTYVKGFTLIELMVVIGIIGVLAAVAIPNYQAYRLRTNMTVMLNVNKQYMDIMAQNIALYGTCNNPNPNVPGLPWGGAITPEFTASPTTAVVRDVWVGPYNNGCLSQTDGNPAVFGGNGVTILYLSSNPANLVSANDRIVWTCYYNQSLGGGAFQQKIVAALPPGCQPRVGW